MSLPPAKSFPPHLDGQLEREARVKTQTAVAPLFFANTSPSRRLDYFETELQSALGEAMSAQNVRGLQFPRTTAAMGEADLVVAGLVEQDQDAWQKVADIYVWGQYEEVNPNDFSFQETPVNFTLNFWDAKGEAQLISETVKVSELPQLKKRLVEKILAAANPHQTNRLRASAASGGPAASAPRQRRSPDAQTLRRNRAGPATIRLRSPPAGHGTFFRPGILSHPSGMAGQPMGDGAAFVPARDGANPQLR